MKISEIDYMKYRDEYDGYCPECDEFTSSGVEPDAEGYVCEVCGGNTVMGAEQAILTGMIEVEYV